MVIDATLFELRHERNKTLLVVQGKVFGLEITVTADDLDRLANWLDREAAKLKPPPEPAEKER